MRGVLFGAFWAIFVLLCSPQWTLAHFGLLIPSSSTVTEKQDATLQLKLAFTHPRSGHGMPMARPEKFFVVTGDEKTNLLSQLQPIIFRDQSAWECEYKISRPGVYQFAFSPQPYFEATEDIYIIHYTKTIVGAFGAEDGWETPLGLPLEIVPLSRPFANYAGNIFSGTVLYNGKPLPNALIEVECLDDGSHPIPNPYYETQSLRTDTNGNFSFGIPWAGWWGFSALATAPEKTSLNGVEKEVELGGVIWLQFTRPTQTGSH